MTGILFSVGVLGLWLGAELVIRAALSLAHRLKLSETFVGLTILALGTSLPEATVSVMGAFDKLAGATPTELVLGNVIGASFAQLGLVLGVSGLLRVLKLQRREIFRSGIIMIGAVLTTIVVSWDGRISRWEATALLFGYLVYLWELRNTKMASLTRKKVQSDTKLSLVWSWLLLLVGVLALTFFSQLVITQGEKLALLFGISEAIVGLVLVSLGTSLPEFVVSTTAALRGSNGLSVGNVIGSVITNLTLVLGLGSFIAEWEVPRLMAQFDLSFLLFFSVVVYLFLLSRQRLERKESLLILALYYLFLLLRLGGFLSP